MKLLKLSLSIGIITLGASSVHAMEGRNIMVDCPSEIKHEQDTAKKDYWKMSGIAMGTNNEKPFPFKFWGTLKILTGVDPVVDVKQTIDKKITQEGTKSILSCTYKLYNNQYKKSDINDFTITTRIASSSCRVETDSFVCTK